MKERDEVSLKESNASRNRDGEVRWGDLRLSDWGLGISEASDMIPGFQAWKWGEGYQIL